MSTKFNYSAERADDGPGFGDYVTVEQKRYGVSNEQYLYKVIGRLRSNSYCDVPVQCPETETRHSEIVDVIRCICCGVSETKVTKFRMADVRFERPTQDR